MAADPKSILDSTKKMLGVDADDDSFDIDIITHINSAFGILSQIGIKSDEGFSIEDRNAKWEDYLGTNPTINLVKTYMYLQVRMWFDPPTLSFDGTAKQAQIDQAIWRLNVAVDTQIVPSVYANAFFWSLEAENVFPPEAEEGDLGIYLPNQTVWRKH